MKNPMQLKTLMKEKSIELGIPSQTLLREFVLEELLYKISYSKYKNHFILKGGFLIASMVEMKNRTTMDIDITVKQYPITLESITKIFSELISLGDSIFAFKISRIEEIREDDEYFGFRVHLKAEFQSMIIDSKIDITTGDVVTPNSIKYYHKRMLNDEYIEVCAYNLETIISEKIESILFRGLANTRMRDFYDVYILQKIYGDRFDYYLLNEAFNNTFKKRNSIELISNYKMILDEISHDEKMKDNWVLFMNKNEYAKGILFENTIDAIYTLLNETMTILNH